MVHPEDGAIWFTDPGYGSMWHYEGNKGPLHHKESVYRIDAKSGKITKLTDEIYKPNDFAFRKTTRSYTFLTPEMGRKLN